MTKQQVFERIMQTMYDALRESEEFQSACDLLPEAGLLSRVDIFLRLYDEQGTAQEPAGAGATNDEDFLRSLRIDPNLEIR